MSSSVIRLRPLNLYQYWHIFHHRCRRNLAPARGEVGLGLQLAALAAALAPWRVTCGGCGVGGGAGLTLEPPCVCLQRTQEQLQAHLPLHRIRHRNHHDVRPAPPPNATLLLCRFLRAAVVCKRHAWGSCVACGASRRRAAKHCLSQGWHQSGKLRVLARALYPNISSVFCS